ncbi:MAG: PaaI family thioesterase [Thermoplasmata archaeon]
MHDEYQFLKEMIEKDPFINYVQIKVEDIQKGYAKLSMPFRKEITRLGDIANGGAIATLADTAGGTSVLSYLEWKNQVTLNLEIDYLEPVSNGPVTAEARVIRKGKNVVFSGIEIRDGNGKLCAVARGVWFIKD